MGCDFGLIWGAVQQERLPLNKHLQFLRAGINQNMLAPPYRVMVSPNGRRSRDTTVVYEGTGLEDALATFALAYDEGAVCVECERVDLSILNLARHQWPFGELTSLPEPRIWSGTIAKEVRVVDEMALDQEKWRTIGPFYDTFAVEWYSHPLTDDGYLVRDYQYLLESALGCLCQKYWGLLVGGDTTTC